MVTKKEAGNWFWQRWLDVLEGETDEGRFTRGRRYANNGSILSQTVAPGRLKGRVEGSEAAPYKVSIRVPLPDDHQWETVLQAIRNQPLRLSRLLAGEWPPEAEDLFAAASIELVPELDLELLSCDCGDWYGDALCKHLIALWYSFGQQVSSDPFKLFALYGRDRDQVLTAVGLPGPQPSGGPEPPTMPKAAPPTVPAAVNNEQLWQPGPALLGFSTQLVPLKGESPSLTRLGEPPFWSGDFAAALRPAYEQVSKRTVLWLVKALKASADVAGKEYKGDEYEDNDRDDHRDEAAAYEDADADEEDN